MISIISVVLGILILGILVFVHELGHFVVAKLCGIRVLTFSLGFGSAIVNKKIGDTDYRISMIPFGGYVKMAGENPEEGREGAEDEFPSRPVWQRASVAIAGPAANFIFAFACLWIMFIYGIEKPVYMERPIIGAVLDSSYAKNAGFAPGDSVVGINGRPIASWEDIQDQLSRQDPIYAFSIYRNGAKQTINLSIHHGDDLIPKQPTGGLLPALPAIAGGVNPGSAADKGGMKQGDTIVGIDGHPIASWFQLTELVKSNTPGTPMQFQVIRNNAPVTLQITPIYDNTEKRPLIGIRPGEGKTHYVKYSPIPAFHNSVAKSWDYTTMIFDVLGKLFSRQVSVKQLSGPIGIIPASGMIALQGLSPILNFMALIGINLAVLNLLPLVITDGGLLLFLIVEVIRRRPLSIQMQGMINRVAIAFFLLLFLYVTFNDVLRLPQYFQLFGK